MLFLNTVGIFSVNSVYVSSRNVSAEVSWIATLYVNTDYFGRVCGDHSGFTQVCYHMIFKTATFSKSYDKT